jgi:hypothetical protein
MGCYENVSWQLRLPCLVIAFFLSVAYEPKPVASSMTQFPWGIATQNIKKNTWTHSKAPSCSVELEQVFLYARAIRDTAVETTL